MASEDPMLERSGHRPYPRSRWETCADVATLLVVVVALLFAGWTVWERFRLTGSRGVIPTKDREISEWIEVSSGGRWIGPEEAQVLIVVFEDYECPFSRQVEGPLSLVREDYPEEVAVIHRHLPLSIHGGAYRAARMAECAGEQGQFEAMHRFLFRTEDLVEVNASVAADSAGVPDVVAFVECTNRGDPVPQIEGDLELAARLGINAVPAIIFEGTLLAPPPDSMRLTNLVRSELLGRDNPQSASRALQGKGGSQ